MFAFAILGILGLVSVGLSTAKDANEDSALSLIYSTINAKLSVNASALTSPQYFNQAGNILPSGSSEAHYRVTVTAVDKDTIKSLFNLSDANGFNVWSVRIDYPAPAYTHSEQFIISNFTDPF